MNRSVADQIAQAQVLPYARRSADRPIVRIFSWITLALALLSLLSISMAGLVLQPRFVAMLKDFGISLPRLTLVLLAIPVSAYRAVTTAACVVLVLKEFLVRRKSTALTINLVSWLVCVAFSLTWAFGMFSPLVQIIRTP